ncbi:MAG: TolC family protein [Planctomycetes bacterium]|nr:TolC family protein [Planctomycetota bacterium]
MRSCSLLILGCFCAGCAWDATRPAEILHEAPPLAEGGTRPERSGRALDEEARAAAEAGELTLVDAMRAALLGYESLRVGAERVFDAEMQRREAIAAVLPRVDLRGLHAVDEEEVAFGGSSVTPRERTESWVAVSQTIYSGRLAPGLRAIEQARVVESLRLAGERERLLFETAARFYDALASGRDTSSRGSESLAVEESLPAFEARMRAGEATPAALARARAANAEASARLAEARVAEATARARLSEITGIDPLPPGLADSLEVLEGTPDDIPRLVDTAFRERLDVRIARAEIARAEARSDVTAREYHPELVAEYTHWLRRDGGFNEEVDWTLSLGLRWTLFDGGGREARLARGLSAVRQRQGEVRLLERRVRVEIEEAVLAYRSLEAVQEAYGAVAAAARTRFEEAYARCDAGEWVLYEAGLAEAASIAARNDADRVRWARTLAALRIRLAAGDLGRVEPMREALEGE